MAADPRSNGDFRTLTVLGFHLALEDTAAWWSETLVHYESFLNTIFSGQIAEEKIHQMVSEIVPMATGLFSAVILLGVFCQLLAARWWQAALFRPGGLAKEFVEIRPGIILASLFTVTFLGSIIQPKFCN